MKLTKIGVLLALLLFTFLLPLFSPNPAVTAIAVFTLLAASAATGWNIFSGYTGYVSLGYGTYLGLGAYSMALMCQNWQIPGGYTPFLLVPVAGVITALMALPLGWLSLRVRGHTFVIITIATIFIFQLLASNMKFLTDGNEGMFLPLTHWHADFNDIPFYYVSLILLLGAIFISWRIRHSKYGLGLLAIRDDEQRAQGLGIRTGAYKLSAFAISGLLGGLVGAISAYYVGFVLPPTAFDPAFDAVPVLMVYLGGTATLSGPLIGALVLEPLKEYLIFTYGAIGLDLILFGTLMLVVILLLPKGVVPAFTLFRRQWAARRGVSSSHPDEKADRLLLDKEASEVE